VKVGVTICVADFHDLCLQLFMRASFGESRKVDVMEFELNETQYTLKHAVKCTFHDRDRH